jgi:hypothetical protein
MTIGPRLTSETRLTICDAIRVGAGFEAACRQAGVAPSTGWEWRARGEGRDPRRRATTRYVLLAEAVAQASGSLTSSAGPRWVRLLDQIGRLRTDAKQVTLQRKPANPSGMRSLRSRGFTTHAIARARVKKEATGRLAAARLCRGGARAA